MCNHERLLDYLYDELSPFERSAVERHLHECGACRTELAELGGTRLALASWSPPESELGFRIVRNTASELRRPAFGLRPAWGLAAAAVLVLAVAAAVANVELRYGADGVTVRTGWSRGVEAPESAAAAGSPAGTSEQMKADLRLLETRLRQLEQSNPRTVSAASVADPAENAGRARMSDAALLGLVRKIIAESEERQQRELAFRVTQVIRDFDATRAGDLARVEQGLRQIQGLTDAELIRHRDTLNHLLRVTQQR